MNGLMSQQKVGQDGKAAGLPRGQDGKAAGLPRGQDGKAAGLPRGQDGKAAGLPRGQDGKAAGLPHGQDGKAAGLPRGQDGKAAGLPPRWQGSWPSWWSFIGGDENWLHPSPGRLWGSSLLVGSTPQGGTNCGVVSTPLGSLGSAPLDSYLWLAFYK